MHEKGKSHTMAGKLWGAWCIVLPPDMEGYGVIKMK